jgi:SAM-dependent methyltransferase
MDVHASYADSPILAESYDLVPAYVNRPDKDYYLRSAAASTGRILELGCGTGRILIPIAESGYAITGLDISEHMLSKCRQKMKSLSRQSEENVQLIKADMTCFKLDDLFHLAIIPFHAFQHLISIDDQVSCLSTLNRHLKMKARLIFDIFNVDFKIINNPRFYDEIEDLPEYKLQDGRRLRRTGRIANFHAVEQYNDVELIYYLTDVNGTTERIVHAFPFRYFFRYEIEHLLARCGFKIIDLLGDFDESPFTHDSPEMIFVAEKCKEIQ